MACFFNGAGDIVWKRSGGSAGPRAIFKDECGSKFDFFHCGAGSGEVIVSFSREADDEVAAEGHIRCGGTKALNFFEVLSQGILAVHRAKNAI